jgi:hypothetical protein
MLVSSAYVATERPALYLKQLCEHFADETQRHSPQEFEVAFDDHEGRIDFAPVVSGTCRLDARRDGVLVVEVGATDQPALERVQRIVATHLQRFGARDSLRVEWDTTSNKPSTG